MRHLELEQIDFKKIDSAAFFSWTKQLNTLKLKQVEIHNLNLDQLLDPESHLRHLTLESAILDLDRLNDLLHSAKLESLELNSIPSVYQFPPYKHLKRVTLTNQKLVATETSHTYLKGAKIQRCQIELKSFIGVFTTCFKM